MSAWAWLLLLGWPSLVAGAGGVGLTVAQGGDVVEFDIYLAFMACGAVATALAWVDLLGGAL